MKTANALFYNARNGATWIDSTNKSFSDLKWIAIMISMSLVNSKLDVVVSGCVQRSLGYDKSRHCCLPRSRFFDPAKNLKRKTESVITHGFLAPFSGNRSNERTDSPEDRIEDTLEYDKLENGEDIVLMEITQSDGSVASFIYKNDATIDAVAANDLCIKNNWPSRPVEKFASALEKSYLVASIWLRLDGNHETDRLIAIGRVTSDHACNAVIWDVMVDPEYQGKGLGRCLVERIVGTLMRRDITNITLFAVKQRVKFYRKLGFEADLKGIKGMFWCPRGTFS